MEIVKKFPILLPAQTSMEKWAVIACDQHTTDRAYWDELSAYVDGVPSSLHLIFPEVYLGDKNEDVEGRIRRINDTMRAYLQTGVFREVDGYVLTMRTLRDGRKRLGLVASVDLEEYDYKDPSAKIRSTEETIEERLPIRIHIRENAPIELPHVLLLLDDAERRVVKPIYDRRAELKTLYDFDLNQNGGHVVGYEVPEAYLPAKAFDELLSPALQKEKYGKNANILFAVGDGNHSMATAKACWERLKPTLSEEARKNHPARYALVEILNVYDDALDFLPINRNVFCDNPEEFVRELGAMLTGKGRLRVITKSGERFLPCPEDAGETIVAVQDFLERKKADGVRIEYVHEENKVVEDGKTDNGVGIIMPTFPKERLFPYVVKNGKLPKKAFSMGESYTKKYYIEAKRIMDYGTEGL